MNVPRLGPISRRSALRAGGAGALAVAGLSACDVLSTSPEKGPKGEETARAGGSTTESKEAPSLHEQVRAGKLPPLDKRLPVKPVVVQPTEKAGVYGGTWHTALLGPADDAWLHRTVGYEDLMRWNHPWTDTIPNVAQSVDFSSDGLQLTIGLRKGMKWSDGHPFTADDLVFAWNDVLLNDEITPVKPNFVLGGDQPGALHKINNQTVKIMFPKPCGLLSLYLAYTTDELFLHPAHYLKQFHGKYNPEVDKKAEAAGFPDWIKLFMAKSDVWSNKDLPRFHPWIPTTDLGAGTRFIVERNPYYFKTDPQGLQLPYLDKVVFDIIDNSQTILLKALHGDIDFSTRHINTPTNKPVLARNREKSNFHFTTLKPAFSNEMIIALNLAHKNPVKREIFQNRDFRIGLSYAINREQLIEATYKASGQPWQAAPRKPSYYFDEEFAKQYTHFSVDKANEHLDKAGYSQRDAQGFRLGPDGKRITFAIEVAAQFIPFWVDAMQIVTGRYWKAVGVDARVKSEDRSLFYERKEANEHDGGVWTDAGGLTNDIILDPRWYFPYSLESVWATTWAQWFQSDGRDGEEPPPEQQEQMELYKRLLVTPTASGRKKLFTKILEIAKENFYVMGTIQANEYYGIVGNNFKNVPESMPASHIYDTPAPSNPGQYYMGQ